MLTLLFIIGTVFSHRGGRRCRTEIVDLATQDSDLQTLLLPFTGAASDGEEGTGDDETGEIAVLSTSSTSCVMRGLSRQWPHEDAEPEVQLRRLLRRGRRNKVKFAVNSQSVGALSRKNRDGFVCYEDGSVSFAVSSVDVSLSQTVALRRNLRRGGGHHGNHGNNDSSEDDEEPAPFATLTLSQTNAFSDEDGNVNPVSFDLTMVCRPWYRMDDVADGEDETCSVRGLKCHDGEYSFFSTEDGEEQEETEGWFNMKCSSEETFYDDWEACASA